MSNKKLIHLYEPFVRDLQGITVWRQSFFAKDKKDLQKQCSTARLEIVGNVPRPEMTDINCINK